MAIKLLFPGRKNILFFGLLLLELAHAETREVVYLKNGSVIKGVILEQVPDQTLKIQTGDGSVFVYNMEDVEKIAREEMTPSVALPAVPATPSAIPATEEKPYDRPIAFYLKGGFNFPGSIEGKGTGSEVYTCGSTLCRDPYKKNEGGDIDGNLSFLVSAEYQVLPVTAIGVGAGYLTGIAFAEPDDDDRDVLGNVLPLFGIARISLSNSEISPFFMVNMGYNLFFPGPNTEVKANSPGETIKTGGGFFWGTGGGIIFGVPGLPFKLTLEGQYSVVHFSADRTSRGTGSEDKSNLEYSMPRLGILTGLVF